MILMNCYISALTSLMSVAHDIPAIKAAVNWRYEDPVPRDISSGDHPRHAKTFRAGHRMTSAPSMGLHIMSQTRAIHQLRREPGCDRYFPGRLQKEWKLTHPSIPHQRLASSAHCRHKYNFLSLLSRSILPTFEINTIQGGEEILSGLFKSNARSW